MNPLVNAALSRSRTTLSILFVALIAGLSAYLSIPKDGDPDVQIPFVMVTVVHIGASPEDAERLLGRPLERELIGLEGLVDVQTFAIESTVAMVLEFAPSIDIDEAMIDVREKVDIAQAEFPDDTEEPRITQFNTATDNILRLAISGTAPERTLIRLARELKTEIESISAVLNASMYGQRWELLEISIDQSKLEAYQIGIGPLIQTITMNNRLIAAGDVRGAEGRFAVKVPGLIEKGADLGSITIMTHDEAVVTLSDIADIRRSFADRSGYATYNGRPTIGMAVSKRIGENILETSQAVRHTIDRVTADWPANVSVDISYDESERVGNILTDLQANVVNAILLVMVLVVLALGWKSSLLVGVAIPTSFLLAFLAMTVLGMTANMMVMFGLIVAVGMLVDGAIVVVEYADRKIAQGFDRRTAYGAAATRMFWPIISSTLTTLAAFLPLLLWPGITGDYMRFLPITLILTLSGSLLVAVFFLPALAAQLGWKKGGSDDIAHALDPIADAEADKADESQPLAAAYTRLLSWAVERPVRIVSGAFGLLVAIFFLYGQVNYGVILISSEEPPGAQIIVTARGNLSADSSRALVADIEAAILETEGVRNLYSYAGPSTDRNPFDNLPRDTIGEMYMNVADWRGRRPVADIFADIRAAAEKLPGIHVEINPFVQSFDRDKDVVVELLTADRTLLPAAARTIRDFMETEMVGLIDIDDTGSLPGIEWVLDVDRAQARKFGANVLTVGGAVQLVTNGLKVGEYRPDDTDYELDIRVRLGEAQRGISQLDSLRIMTPSGLVPITNFVTREAHQRINTLERRNGLWIIKVRANTQHGVLPNTKVGELKEWLASGTPLPAGVLASGPRLPAGVTHQFGGDDRLQSESEGFLNLAFTAALGLMAIILLTQFNSFYQSALILSAVIMSTAGVLIGMMVTQQPFSVILTGTGIIALAGIVVNNNIVLIDTYQRLIKAGSDVESAIIKAGAQRLRPILLTTITTMVGLMPMVLQVSVNPFAEDWFSYGSPTSYTWKPMSNAIVFGLGFSTLLTLIVTPAALALPLRLRRIHVPLPSLDRLRVPGLEAARAKFGL
ncbi:MAG: efflux RND transporter permease subunit [Rhodobiaceae bacterium]|nr:efflux RND transporter permease subunit [Rhodobiaceae bacterium]